jgi:VWFA-related protein
MPSSCKFAFLLALVLLTPLAFAGARVTVSAQEKPDANVQRPRRLGTPPQNPPQSPPDEAEVVRVETDLVNVLFTASDKEKRFITLLKQEDIRITEDGVPQEVSVFQRETDRPLSLVILIDVSASQQYTLPAEKAAAHTFITTVIRPGKDEAGIISFTGDATLEQGLTGNPRRLQEAIERVEVVLPPGYIGGGISIPTTPPIFDPRPSRVGTTAIWDAVWVTAEDVLSPTTDKTRRAIILLSDGVDTSSRVKRSEAIDRAVKADSVIYSIGIGDSVAFQGIEKDTLRKLSERTGGRAFFPKDERDLRAAFAQIQEELRSQYLIAYSPTNRKKDGSFRNVKIEVTNPELKKQKLQLTYRQGYFAKPKAASQKTDVTPDPLPSP